jgi:hypothetical protein
MTPSKEAIMEDMEKLQKEQELCFTIPATFGGGAAIIQLNPNAGKRYILKVAKDLETARSSSHTGPTTRPSTSPSGWPTAWDPSRRDAKR